jgi:hypothetical protein
VRLARSNVPGALLATASRTARRPGFRLAAFAVLCVLVWATHATLPVSVVTDDRDPSWRAALGYALDHGLQAGKDYVFTYGPLGYFSTNVYVPEIFGIRLAWEACFGLVLAAVVVGAASRIRSAPVRWLCLLLILVQPMDGDAYAFLGMTSAAACVLGSTRFRSTAALLGLVLLAAFPLIKFSYAIPAASCAIAIASTGGRRAGWALLSSFPVLVASWWVLAGQSASNLPAYVGRSFELASGYSAGMSLPAPPGARGLAFALMPLCAVIAGARASDPPSEIPRTAFAGAFLATLWVAFKAGFVRGLDHTPSLFGFTLVAPFLLQSGAASSSTRRAAAVAAQLACAALSLAGLAADTGDIPHGPKALLVGAARRAGDAVRAACRPAALRADCEQSLADARTWRSLPRTREIVRQDSIDMISSRQGMLFLNDLHWTPRPVFQGYATLSTRLAELNQSFFQGPGASEYVLFLLESLDHRLPSLDDALALRTIAREYEPVLTEKGYLLLRHAPHAAAPEPPRSDIHREIAFGERLDIRAAPRGCRLVQLDIPYTTWGRWRTFLEQAPAVFADIELDTGEIFRARIVPSMASAGAILDPVLRTYADWEDWCTGGAPPRPVALTILPPESPSMYVGRIGVTILRDDGIVPNPRTDLRADLETSLFATPPIEIRSGAPRRRGVVGDVAMRPGLVLHAPSEMRIESPSGQHTLRIEFGFAADAAPEGPSDGAEFSVRLRRRDGSEVVLFRRFLVPNRPPIEWRPEEAEIRFHIGEPASLLLRTDPGPSGDARGDWTAWCSIALE